MLPTPHRFGTTWYCTAQCTTVGFGFRELPQAAMLVSPKAIHGAPYSRALANGLNSRSTKKFSKKLLTTNKVLMCIRHTEFQTDSSSTSWRTISGYNRTKSNVKAVLGLLLSTHRRYKQQSLVKI